MGLNRLGNYLSQQIWNENIDRLETLASLSTGRGILSGLQLLMGEDLTLTITGGVMSNGTTAQIIAGFSVEAPASASKYVWLAADGSVTYSSTTEDISGGNVCLGRVYTNEDSITSVSSEGRMALARWKSTHEYEIGNSALVINTQESAVGIGGEAVNGLNVHVPASFEDGAAMSSVNLVNQLSAPDVPLSGLTLFAWGGEEPELRITNMDGSIAATRNGCPVAYGYASAMLELEDDLILTPRSASVQALNANGTDRIVQLPTALDWGMYYRILNIGEDGDIVVTTDGVNVIATLEPGDFIEVRPVPGTSGAITWPSTVPVLDSSTD